MSKYPTGYPGPEVKIAVATCNNQTNVHKMNTKFRD